MIRTIVKLALVALVANATWHLFGAYSPHYKFKDGIQYAVLHRADQRLTDEDVQERVLTLAAQFDIPVTAADVSVTHTTNHTVVDVSYVRPVDLAPGVTYPWPF